MARIFHIFLAILRFLRSSGAFLERRLRSFVSLLVFISPNLVICCPWHGSFDPFRDHIHFSVSSTFPGASAPDLNMATDPTSPGVCPGADEGLPPIVQANSHDALHPSADQPSRPSDLFGLSTARGRPILLGGATRNAANATVHTNWSGWRPPSPS
ncbi:hypothetical protein BJV78DRAFT_1349527 [Lactifluus subvellereus]|nr:hypothetical protein BJV78DRAFT_1349527 [Lactifluus subvellereus]